jgi:hypothetical protein
MPNPIKTLDATLQAAYSVCEGLHLNNLSLGEFLHVFSCISQALEDLPPNPVPNLPQIRARRGIQRLDHKLTAYYTSHALTESFYAQFNSPTLLPSYAEIIPLPKELITEEQEIRKEVEKLLIPLKFYAANE